MQMHTSSLLDINGLYIVFESTNMIGREFNRQALAWREFV